MWIGNKIASIKMSIRWPTSKIAKKTTKNHYSNFRPYRSPKKSIPVVDFRPKTGQKLFFYALIVIFRYDKLCQPIKFTKIPLNIQILPKISDRYGFFGRPVWPEITVYSWIRMHICDRKGSKSTQKGQK